MLEKSQRESSIKIAGIYKLDTTRASSEMARGETLPTLTKTKAFRGLLLLAESEGEVKPGAIYEVSKNVLRDLLRCNDDQHLASELNTLADVKVDWSKLDPEAGGYTRPVSSCWWHTKTDKVKFAFDPQFISAWADNSNGFRRIQWEVLVAFRSLFAAKIYEYCAVSYERGRTVSTPRLLLSDLRKLLGIAPTAYIGVNSGKLYKDIAKAVETVNREQPGFLVTYARSGRGQHGWHSFIVEDGPSQERLRISSPVKKVGGNDLRDRIQRALAELTAERRLEVETWMTETERFPAIPAADDIAMLRSYAGALVGIGVSIPPPKLKEAEDDNGRK